GDHDVVELSLGLVDGDRTPVAGRAGSEDPAEAVGARRGLVLADVLLVDGEDAIERLLGLGVRRARQAYRQARKTAPDDLIVTGDRVERRARRQAENRRADRVEREP